MLYGTVLWLHGLVRWLLLAALVVVLGRAIGGFRRAAPYAGHAKLHAALVGLSHLQLVLGLALYLSLSPVTQAFFANAKQAMREPALRFFGVEHMVGMVLAVAFVQVSRARAKRASEDRVRHRRTATWLALALLAIMGSMPWPWSKAAPRPLLRGFSSAVDRNRLPPPHDAPGWSRYG